MPNAPELVLVMPVYNEQDSIREVISRWDAGFAALGMDYRIRVYNDGSTDGTASILDELALSFQRLEVYHKSNSGHGPTILSGYRMAEDSEWLFQLDSDDEMGSEGFERLWLRRNEFDFLVGRRSGRSGPVSRRLVSFISRLVVVLFYGRGVYDVNSPYRLMRTAKFAKLFNALPDDTFAPNIVISGFACRRRLRIYETPVAYRPRRGGETSIKKWRLFRAAIKSFQQSIAFRFSGLVKAA